MWTAPTWSAPGMCTARSATLARTFGTFRTKGVCWQAALDAAS